MKLALWCSTVALVALIGFVATLIPVMNDAGPFLFAGPGSKKDAYDKDDQDAKDDEGFVEEVASKSDTSSKKPKLPRNSYSAAVSNKKAQQAFFFLRTWDELWQPFCFQLTVGLFDQNKIGGFTQSSIFGAELDVRDSEPFRFYGLFLQVSGAGFQVFVASDQGNHGIAQFTNTQALDLLIEATDTELRFLARPAGSGGAYTLVDALPFTNQTEPLAPGYGMFNIGPKVLVGFDNFCIVKNNPPVPEGIVKTLMHDILQQIGLPLSRAAKAFDGAAVFDNPALATDGIVDLEAAIAAWIAMQPRAAALDTGNSLEKDVVKAIKTGLKQSRKALKSAEKPNLLDLKKPKAPQKVVKAVKASRDEMYRAVRMLAQIGGFLILDE
jgi:hypothetical protein